MCQASFDTVITALVDKDPDLKSIALESFCIHARNIRDFFATSGRAKRDDVLAADFLGRPMRVRLTHLRSVAVRNRLNKRIAHLSYARARLGRLWNIQRIKAEIDTAMHQFEARLRVVDPSLAAIVAGAA
jgi:hypothetical protein